MGKIPILKMGDFLLVTIQVDMHDQMAAAVQDDLTSKIAQLNAKGVHIDISSLDIVDSFIGRMLANTSTCPLPPFPNCFGSPELIERWPAR
jgi:rsbT antagonist protein RsbS